jgi:hypothetical protein
MSEVTHLEPVIASLLKAGKDNEALRLVRSAAISKKLWESFITGVERKLSYKLRPCTSQEYGYEFHPPRVKMRTALREGVLVLLDYLLEKNLLHQEPIGRTRQHSGSPHYLGEQFAALLLGEDYTKREKWNTSKTLWVRSEVPSYGTASGSFEDENLWVYPIDKDTYYDAHKLQELRARGEDLEWVDLKTLPHDKQQAVLAWNPRGRYVQTFWIEGVALSNVPRMLHDSRVEQIIEDLKSCENVGLK